MFAVEMRLRCGLVLVLVLLFPAPALGQETGAPTVDAVLFFSPTCGHCEYVIQEVLPPLFEEHGGPWDVSFDESLAESGVPYFLLSNGTLRFLLVDVTVEAGFELFDATTTHLTIGNGAVPRLIVSNQVMIGSVDIPERLPPLVASGLAAGGIEWPDLPGLEAALGSVPEQIVIAAPEQEEPLQEPEAPDEAATPPETTPTVTSTTVPTTVVLAEPLPLPVNSDDSIVDRFQQDTLANTLAVAVLIAMSVSVVAVVGRIRRRVEGHLSAAIPWVAGGGVLVAGYLTYVEVSSSDAACGPVGNCNAVQQSQYAEVFGIPIGVLGLVGYGLVIAAWLGQRIWTGRKRSQASVALLAGTVVGVGFSIYLTFLEPFVIGATCVWCLASAIIVTTLMWLAAGPAVTGWSELRRSGDPDLEVEEFPAQLVR